MRQADAQQSEDEQRQQCPRAPVVLPSPAIKEEERRRDDNEGSGNDRVGNAAQEDDARNPNFGSRGKSLRAEEGCKPTLHCRQSTPSLERKWVSPLGSSDAP